MCLSNCKFLTSSSFNFWAQNFLHIIIFLLMCIMQDFNNFEPSFLLLYCHKQTTTVFFYIFLSSCNMGHFQSSSSHSLTELIFIQQTTFHSISLQAHNFGRFYGGG